MKDFHPVSAAVFFAAMIISLMLVNNPAYTAVSIIGAVIILFIMQGVRSTLRTLGGFMGLFLIMSMLNPLFVHRGSTPLFFLNGRAITFEAILYGMNSSFSLIIAVLWCKGFSLAMTSERLFCIIGRLSPKIAAMLMMTVRFVPDMLRQAKKISIYNRLSGEADESTLIGRIKRVMSNFSALVTWSVENSVQTADSMTARGFELGGRTSYSSFSFKAEDAALTVLSLISCAAVLIAGDSLQVQFYPVAGLPPFGGAFAAAASACAVCWLYPALFEWSVTFRRQYNTKFRGELKKNENN